MGLQPELEVDLFSLLTAFRAVVERAKQRPKVLLPPEQMPIEVRIEQLLARLSEADACGFEELCRVHELRVVRLGVWRVSSGSTTPGTWSAAGCRISAIPRRCFPRSGNG